MIGEFQKIQIMIGLVRKPSHVTRHFWWWWWWWWVVVVGGGGGGIRRKNGLYHILENFSSLNEPEVCTYFIKFD